MITEEMLLEDFNKLIKAVSKKNLEVMCTMINLEIEKR